MLHASLQRPVLLLLLLTLSGAGCVARLGGKPNAADQVRRENLQLKKLVEDLKRNLELRTGELASLRQQLDWGPHPMPGAESPALAKIAFGRYCGAVDTDGNEGDDQIRVYVHTLDQRGRMLPVAGRATLQAVLIEPGAAPSLIAERRFDPSQWDAAYRSGLAGTHYTLELPLPETLPRGGVEATLKLSFTQADTGAQFSAQQAVLIDR
jgi:hypothetical protein